MQPTMGLGLARPMPLRASSSACSMKRVACASIVYLEELVEKRVRVGFRVEGNHIVDLLARADKTNGQSEFAGDCHNDAAFGRAIELGENDAGNGDGRRKLAGLG